MRPIDKFVAAKDFYVPARSFSCIFRLAAIIISSLRFCKRRCLSLLFCDHALSCCTIVEDPALETVFNSSVFTLEARLYLDIKSWACIFGVDWLELAVAVAGVAGTEGIGICGWKDGGGCNNSKKLAYAYTLSALLL